MSKSRDRDKKFALACGLGVLAVAGLVVLSWDGLRAWYVGYRFIWLPEGAVPMVRGQQINASGEVVVNLSLEPQGFRAGRWSLATREVLALDVPLAGGESSMVFAINDAGDMVGMVSQDQPPRGYHPSRLFLWTKVAGVRDLATLEGEHTFPTAINERGQVAGWSTLPLNTVSHAFLWSADSGVVDLGSLAPEKESRASSINEAGWVVGRATAADGLHHPFLWKPETGMQDLGLPFSFRGGDAGHINEQGEVLVNFYTDGLYAPFVWREKDGFVKLPVPAGFVSVRGIALNNPGTVLLGALRSNPASDSIDCIGYLIANGILKELPSAPGAKSTGYCGINDKGWLVGVARMKDEPAPWRGFVALPVR